MSDFTPVLYYECGCNMASLYTPLLITAVDEQISWETALESELAELEQECERYLTPLHVDSVRECRRVIKLF